MPRLAIVLVATLVVTAQCAVFRNEESMNRIARSPCDTCHRDGPPGPPPYFHTRQWSGYARSADGSQQGVFSGAAAQALDGSKSDGEAYSLAGSTANANIGKDSYNAQHLKDDKNDVQQIQSSGFGASSHQAHSKNYFGSSAQGSGYGQGDLGNQQQIQPAFGTSAASQAQKSSDEGYGSNYGGENLQQQQQFGWQSVPTSQDQHRGQGNVVNSGKNSYNDPHQKEGGNDQHTQSSAFGSTSQAKAKNSYGAAEGSDFGRGDLGNEKPIQSEGLENQQQTQSGFGLSTATGTQSSSGGGYGSSGRYHGTNGVENLHQQQQLGSQGLLASQNQYKEQTNDVQQIQGSGFGSTSQAKAKNSYGNIQGSDFGRGDVGNEQQIQSAGLENQQQIQSGFEPTQAQSSSGGGYSSSGRYQGNNGAQNLQQQQQFGSQGLSASEGKNKEHNQYGQQGSYGYGSGSGYSGHQNSHEALKGALDLAQQGLQTPQAGCSTCGKSSYALSNAKSHTGNAVALSISG